MPVPVGQWRWNSTLAMTNMPIRAPSEPAELIVPALLACVGESAIFIFFLTVCTLPSEFFDILEPV
jgi:hypothetical protein